MYKILDKIPIVTLVLMYMFAVYGLLLDSPYTLLVVFMLLVNTIVVKLYYNGTQEYFLYSLGLLLFIFITKIYINTSDRTIVDIEYVKYDSYKYTDNSLFINYEDVNKVEAVPKSKFIDGFDYMKLNNCEPILLRTTYKYWADCEEVKETVKCYKDISID